jgi:hypothetical protein
LFFSIELFFAIFYSLLTVPRMSGRKPLTAGTES